MNDVILKAAREYLSQNINPIPFALVQKNGELKKQPLVKWAQYQNERVEEKKLSKWFAPGVTMLGANTGQISDLVTVDVDTDEGKQIVEDLVPDSIEVPIYKTPRGGFQMCFRAPEEKIPGSVRFLPGIDYRGEGSLAILPPSYNHLGRYVWIDSCPPLNERPALPDTVKKVLLTVTCPQSLYHTQS
jgi:hypothetical protein